MSWEALPKRKKARNSSDNDVSKESVDKKASNVQITEKDNIFDQITANIAERSKINRTQTTLESKDGCGNENYECLLFCFCLFSGFCVSVTDFLFLRSLDLDHTADVQCHAWGNDLKEAFEKMAECMLNYMTDITLIETDEQETITIRVQGENHSFASVILYLSIHDSNLMFSRA
jgi:hypothetical protein